jgi:ATP-dependent DNA helicase PIF1
LYKCILAYFRSQSQVVIAVASSGIASLLLPGGRTAHSKFKIPIKLSQTFNCNINVQSDDANLIREAKLILWDEAPMMQRHAFEAVDRALRDITKVNEPFGGKKIVFGGDFRQILPVIING